MAVRVSLTERVRIEAGGAVVDEARFPGRQGRLLFAYLVAEQGRPVPRDELAEALWGDVAAGDVGQGAVGARQQAPRPAHRVRAGRRRPHLTGAFGCYRLDLPEGSWIDVIAADEAASEAEHALAAGDLEQARAEASTAESLTRRPSCPERTGAWVEEKRARARQTSVPRADCLADACRLSGDASEAAIAGRAGDRPRAVSRDRIPAPDGGAHRRRQSRGGAPGVRAVPTAARGGARGLPVARDRVDLPPPARSAFCRLARRRQPRRRHATRHPSPTVERGSKSPAAGVRFTKEARGGGIDPRGDRGSGRGHPRDTERRRAAGDCGGDELDRRPRPVRFDRGDRPGRRSTGRDRLGRRRAVGRRTSTTRA